MTRTRKVNMVGIIMGMFLLSILLKDISTGLETFTLDGNVYNTKEYMTPVIELAPRYTKEGLAERKATGTELEIEYTETGFKLGDTEYVYTVKVDHWQYIQQNLVRHQEPRKDIDTYRDKTGDTDIIYKGLDLELYEEVDDYIIRVYLIEQK